MVEWHHLFNGHEFEQAPGDGEGQGSPALLQSIGSHRAGYNSKWDLSQVSKSRPTFENQQI